MNKIIKKIISGTVLCTMLTYTMPILAYTNEETIYSKLNTSGEVYKSIVSTITENETEGETVQEDIEKELPVDCNVTYTLDGEVMSAENIAGKSGEVKITLEYTNKVENEVNINGNIETMYTPFLVVSGVIIDNDNNKDIKISNGKLINNGDKTIAVGFALPGMQENFELEDVNIPNTIEITMNATNFELGNIMSFATPKILEEGSLDDIYDELDEVYSQVDSLEEASGELENGTITLRDGIITLNNGTKTLNNGARDLKNGIDALKAGSSQVNAGANTLKNGTNEYASNSNKLNENMQKMSVGTAELNNSYSQIDNGIKSIEAQLPALTTGTATVYGALAGDDGIVNKLSIANQNLYHALNTTPTPISDTNNSEAIQYVNSAIEAVNVAKNTSVTTNDNSAELDMKKGEIQGKIDSLNVAIGVLSTGEITPEIQSAIDTISESARTLEASKELLQPVNQTVTSADLSNVESNLYSAKSSLENVQTPVAYANPTQELVDGYAQIERVLSGMIVPALKDINDGVNSLSGGIETISGGSTKVKAGIETVNSSASQLSEANNKLNEAANTISKGAADLANGSASLDEGASKLVQGSDSLTSGTNSLSNGADSLLDGGNKLVEGVQKFNNEGIQKICNMVNGDVKKAESKLRTMEDLSNEYQRFASDMSRDEIKFISILDSIKVSSKDEDKNEFIETSKIDTKKEKNK